MKQVFSIIGVIMSFCVLIICLVICIASFLHYDDDEVNWDKYNER